MSKSRLDAAGCLQEWVGESGPLKGFCRFCFVASRLPALQNLLKLLQMLKLGDTNGGCLPSSWQRPLTLCDFSSPEYVCVDVLECSPRSLWARVLAAHARPDYAGITDCHRHFLLA